MSGRKSKSKGYRREIQVRDMCRAVGLEAERVPLSGAAPGSPGDIRLSHRDGRFALCGEVKARANGEGFMTLERWLGDNDVLFLVRDRAEPLVVLPWRTWRGVCK